MKSSTFEPGLNHFCVRCSVFENDENVAGWKTGKSVAVVAHCESCFREKNYNILWDT